MVFLVRTAREKTFLCSPCVAVEKKWLQGTYWHSQREEKADEAWWVGRIVKVQAFCCEQAGKSLRPWMDQLLFTNPSFSHLYDSRQSSQDGICQFCCKAPPGCSEKAGKVWYWRSIRRREDQVSLKLHPLCSVLNGVWSLLQMDIKQTVQKGPSFFLFFNKC